MRASREFLGGTGLFLSALVLVAWPQSSVSGASPQLSQGQAQTAESVPAYHSELPAGPLPGTMDPSHFSDPVVKNAYHLAGRVKKVLYKQPCYCRCDRTEGHQSLLDCFVSKHAAMCDICIKEDIYAYEQTRKGKSPEQIRAGILRGEWQKVDIAKYQTYPPKP
jgi:Protein of unknown function with PCYCGC motif